MVVQWGAWGEVGMAASLDEVHKRRLQEGPQPPFSNKEGLAGLEMGLRSTIAYFSVFKWNVPIAFWTVQGHDGIGQQYYRNFISKSFPPPPPPPSDKQDPYDLVR